MAKQAASYRDYPCDLCGADRAIEIPYCRLYTNDQAIHICGDCGFVYVRARRSSEEIARVWAEEIYGGVYTAVKNPAVMGRQTFVAEFLASRVDLEGKKVCDIGAGEGFFLKYLQDHYRVEGFGIEPSTRNCNRLEQLGVRSFDGTIEQFIASRDSTGYRADVATIMWTLENCLSCIDMLRGAAALLETGGRLLVATGSRILVPFKKPLFQYFSHTPADSHCFRFSANALQSALAKAGLRTIATNRYLDNDILCVLAEKVGAGETIPVVKDHPLEVLSFFERWHHDSMHYLKDWGSLGMGIGSAVRSVKVSVYVVSHDYGRFLSEAVESVLRQHYDDWELLLVDDGSSDNTADVMRLYSGDPRVRVLTTEGIGLPAVCNLALREARGEYVIRLDGDDVLDENALLVLVSYLDREPDLAIVFPDYYLMDEGGEILAHERRHKLSETNHRMEPPPNGACTLIRKSVLESIGGYREDLGAQDGLDLWARIRDTHRAANVNLPLFYYRRHGHNLTNSAYRILAARRQIKKDAISAELERFRPLLAVVPCRRNYDFRRDLWSVELNGKSLLKRKLEMCLSSTLFDKVVVTSDTDAVLPTLEAFDDRRIEFFKRDASETLRSRNIVGTLSRVAQEFDPTSNGVTVLCYLPSPFVTLGSLEEAVCTLVFNDADSSVGVEEIKEPVFCRTPFGLKAINAVSGFRTDFDFVYREANIALATKNKNVRTGSLVGPRPINFIVAHEESFFIDSEKKLQIAHILDAR